MKYGRAIRIARAARGFSKQVLAKNTNLDASYITLIEQGKRTPSTKALSAIAGALSIPVHLLSLLGAEGAELKSLSSADAEFLGRRLLEIVVAEEGDGAVPEKAD